MLYDGPLAKLIQAQLESDPSAISPGTRSQILEDYFQFAEASKKLPFTTAFMTLDPVFSV